MMSSDTCVDGARITGNGDNFSAIGRRFDSWLTKALDGLLDHFERRRELAALAQMDERSLKDIGLTRPDAEWIVRN